MKAFPQCGHLISSIAVISFESEVYGSRVLRGCDKGLRRRGRVSDQTASVLAMTTYIAPKDSNTDQIATWMWVWFVASALSTGIAAGIIFQHWGAFFGGIVIALIANIPLMALFKVGQKVLINLVVARKHVARIPN